MSTFSKLFCAAAISAAMASTAAAQKQKVVGDKDDQVVIRGCVMKAGEHHSSGPRTLLVWSRGDVYLDSAVIDLKPSEGSQVGQPNVPVFYWLDDEDDFAKYAGKRVEIVGEAGGEIKKGELEIDHKDDFTKVEFKMGSKKATARIPTAWLGPAPKKDSDLNVLVRPVDVEKVNVLAESCTN
jgi:hypothetical protein